jgi:hypothetical protein
VRLIFGPRGRKSVALPMVAVVAIIGRIADVHFVARIRIPMDIALGVQLVIMDINAYAYVVIG